MSLAVNYDTAATDVDPGPQTLGLLPTPLLLHIASLVSPNEVATCLRLVCSMTASVLSLPQHKQVRLAQALLPHALVDRWGRDPCAMKGLRRDQRTQLLCCAARIGSIKAVAALSAVDGRPLQYPVLASAPLTAAAGARQLAMCRWLREQGSEPDERPVLAAAAAGDVDVLSWTMEEAFSCGRLDVAWTTPRARRAAARAGHQAALQWLAGPKCCGSSSGASLDNVLLSSEGTDLAAAACEGGHKAMMGWLLGELARVRGSREARAGGGVMPYVPELQVVVAAFKGCSLSTCQRLLAEHLGAAASGPGVQQPPPQPQPQQQPGGGADDAGNAAVAAALPRVFDDAAGLELLYAALASTSTHPVDSYLAKTEWLLAAHPQLAALDFTGVAVGEDVLDAAEDASGRLAWMHARGLGKLDASGRFLPATVALVRECARRRHLVAFLRLLVGSMGPEGVARVRQETAEDPPVATCAEAVQLMQEAGLLPQTPTQWQLRAAASAGDVAFLAWLLDRKPQTTRRGRSDRGGPTAMVLAAAAGCGGGASAAIEAVAWLRSRGCPWDGTALCAAVEVGEADRIEWMAAQGCPVEVGALGCAQYGAHVKGSAFVSYATLPCVCLPCIHTHTSCTRRHKLNS